MEVDDLAYTISKALQTFADNSYPVKLFLAFFGALLNIFHLLVLTRKAMRTTCINILMTGISLSDFYNTLFIIYQQYVVVNFMYTACNPFGGGTFAIIFEATSSFDNIFRRISAYLAVMLPTVRILTIRNFLNPRFAKAGFGIKVVLICFLISFSIDFFQYSRYNWTEIPEPGFKAPAHCGYPANYTVYYIRFKREPYFSREVDLKISRMLTGLSSLIPAITLPILSFLLIMEIRNAKETIRQGAPSQGTDESSKPDHTTKMIVYMTIASTAAEGLTGLCSVVSSLLNDFSLEYRILWQIQLLFGVLVVFNTSTHCLVSLAISTQYREAAMSLVPCVRTKKATVIKVEPMSHSSRHTSGRG